jgi:hypothetical protein
MLAAAALTALLPVAGATMQPSAAALAPIVVHDSRESSPLVAADGATPTAYHRTVSLADGGAWIQFWFYYRYQDQDRGVLRSGRHEGDWELVQFRVSESGRPLEAVYAQHSGAERCGWSSVSSRAGRPVVFASHGSHASYLRAGVRDRLWPDPNDEADGRGSVVRPRLVEISASSPSFMRRAEPWGASRAAWYVPFEQSSPVGPAYQPDRWDDPAAFAASARSCQADCDSVGECDGPEKALTAAAFLAPLALVVAWWRRRRRG